MKILAFCRYEQDSIFIVITSFEAEPQHVTLCLDELYIPILNMSNIVNKGIIYRDESSKRWIMVSS